MFSDDTVFHLSNNLNRQNTCILLANRPKSWKLSILWIHLMLMSEYVLQVKRCMIFLFEGNTVGSSLYLEGIRRFLVHLLDHNGILNYVTLRQNGSTIHFSNEVIFLIKLLMKETNENNGHRELLI
jgi:hypothetical protein